MPRDDHQFRDRSADGHDDQSEASPFPADPWDDSFTPPDFPHDASRYEPSHNDPIGGEHTRLFAEGHADEATPEFGDEKGSQESYWALSRAPLESLVFTLPLVAVYEIGVLALGRGTPRNGADVWLRAMLDSLGFGAYFFLLPALTIVGLAAWHHLEHERWRFSARVLVGMAFESLALACVLIGLAHLQEGLWPEILPSRMAVAILDTASSVLPESTVLLQRVVGFCGAGLYEEVLFRLLLLPVLAGTLRRVGFSVSLSAAGGVLLSSLLFSAAHYVGVHGEAFDLYSFTFRAVAGLFFGLLFLVRGFGITAGTHAIYDVLVGLL